MAHFVKDALLRRQEVERLCGISRSTLWSRIAAGTFPPPLKTGARSRHWLASAINAYIEQTAAAAKAS